MHLISLSIFFSTLLTTTLSAPQANCTYCAPNPFTTTYPNNVTGTINGTISIIPVPIAYARSLLPSSLAPLIITEAYTRFSIPATHYPLTVEGVIDHDIHFQGVNPVEDFSILRLTFPFLDLLKDGESCFRYTGYVYLPPTVPIAIAGSQAYGIGTINATFDPADAGYKFTQSSNNKKKKKNKSRGILFTVFAGLDQSLHLPAAASLHFKTATNEKDTYPLALYKNITNQPTFGNNTAVCLNQLNLWNSSVTKGENTPVDIVGEVTLSAPLLPMRNSFKDVKGLKATRAFLENNLVPCELLRGYNGTGSGDSG